MLAYTPGFDAPELLKNGLSPATDMFAFGRTIAAALRASTADAQASENAIVDELTADQALQKPMEYLSNDCMTAKCFEAV